MGKPRQLRSGIHMKQFRLVACVLLFVLALTCFVNIFYYVVRMREVEARRAERTENLATVYADEFRTMGLLVRHLCNSKLVDDLRYERSLELSAAKKYRSLINALALIEASYSENIQPYVYFHISDTVVGSDGKMDPELLGDMFVLPDSFSLESFRSDRSKVIQAIPGVGMYVSTTYALRSQSDWGTMYVYTQDDVSVLVVSRNTPLEALMTVAAQDEKNSYAVWDSASGQVLLSNVPSLPGAVCATAADVSASMLSGRENAAANVLERGRFAYVLVEERKLDELVNAQINAVLWATATFGLLFVLLYYLILQREVFRPLTSILQKLQVSGAANGEYDAIEDAILNMQSRIDTLSRSLQSAALQERESRMRQALLGIEGPSAPDLPEGRGWFALLSLIGERGEEIARVDEWLRSRFDGRMIANMQERKVYLLWFEEEGEYGDFLAAAEALPVGDGVALGVSREYEDLARVREAYQESSDVVHVCVDAEETGPVLYVAGRNGTDLSVSVPMNARDSGMLLSTIAGGDAEAATQFVAEILDSERVLTIAQSRYRATYLLNILSMAQNTQREDMFDLTVQISRIRAMVSRRAMRELVLDACEALARSFSEVKEDALILFIRRYVEEHYAENIYLKTIAEETGLSYAYVSHYFSEHQGIGFADYLNSVRVEKACEMLADLRIPLNEIAERVGFGSMNTFGRNMKKFTGMTPDAYRKANSGR